MLDPRRLSPPARCNTSLAMDTEEINGQAANSLYGSRGWAWPAQNRRVESTRIVQRFFGLSTGKALTVFLAPLLCWAAQAPLVRARKNWQVVAFCLALVAISLAVVLAMAKRDFDREMAPLLAEPLAWDHE